MPSALRASAIRGREVVCSQASYITSCAFAVASSPRRPPIAARKLSIARRSGKTRRAALGGLGGSLRARLLRDWHLRLPPVLVHQLAATGGHPVLGNDARHGWLADVVEARHLGAGLAAGDDALGDLAPLGGIEFLAPAADTPLGAGGGDAGGGAFADHGALELRERADHLHHHAAGRGGGVDVLGDRPEAGAGLGDPLHDVQHVLERAGQAIELPDDDRVALAQVVEHAVQLGPVPAAARRGLLEDAPAAGGSERPGLQGVVLLVAFGHAGVAEQQARCWRARRLSQTNVCAWSCAATAVPGDLRFQYPLSEWLPKAIPL